MPFRLIGGVALLLAGTACAGDGPSGMDGPEPAAIRAVAVSAGDVLVRTLSVELEAPMAVEVDYWTGAAPRLRAASAAPIRSHEVDLARLQPRSVYLFEARSVTADGRRGEPVRGEFTTDTLPTGLAALDLSARGESTIPVILLEVWGPPPLMEGFVIVDQDGQIVWHWPAGSPQGATRRANGDFVFVDFQAGLTVVSPHRELIARIPQQLQARTVHHDVMATPWNTVYFLGRDRREVDGEVWVGDGIWEWDPDIGAETQVWSAFDFFDPRIDVGPRSRPIDWLHANAISFGPRGNVLVSMQAMDQVASFTAGLDGLEWRLGGPGSTIAVDPEAVFAGQHSAVEIAPQRVLLFDNGLDRPDGSPYSRALELQLDLERNVASVAWAFRPRPDNHATIVSSARRLDNGNTLVLFGPSRGVVSSTGPVEAYEVDEEGEVLWHLTVSGPSLVYRATPLQDIAGERVVTTSGAPP